MDAFELVDEVYRTEKWISMMHVCIHRGFAEYSTSRACARRVFNLFPELRGETKIYTNPIVSFDSTPRLIKKNNG